ncbi:hypothetical protein L1887_23627 [Cichorium endivia]|nr:hypothetical protein L1887_23627 [Cichorium endivia]
MLVPQSMSYAKLAGLQPTYGLYTGLVPVFVYSIFGSSRQLAVGRVALFSLLVSNVLGNIDSSAELYTELAILLSLMVGILECTMGFLRLGWLIWWEIYSIPKEFGEFKSVIPTAMHITGVAILESVGIAKALAAKHGYEPDSNQELGVDEFYAVTYVDSRAVQALKELYQEYASRDIQIAIANPNKEVLLTLAKSGLIEQVGKEWCFVRVHDAVQVCLQHVPNFHVVYGCCEFSWLQSYILVYIRSVLVMKL